MFLRLALMTNLSLRLVRSESKHRQEVCAPAQAQQHPLNICIFPAIVHLPHGLERGDLGTSQTPR